MLEEIGLVLEGGGMRGIYTSGVLDYFMDKDLYFPYVIGVSMGACNAASYISKQRGRNRRINTEFVNDERYISYAGLVKNGSIFGMDFIFNDIPNNLIPFDYESFLNSEQKFKMVTTDIETGKPVYFDRDECKDNYLWVMRASSSLPFGAPIVELDGKKYLDGGITDSIPVKKAIEDGNKKVVVVLTRNKGYKKKPFRHKLFARMVYSKYKNLVNAINERCNVYNNTIEYIEKLEKEGKAFVIRPSRPIKVKRVETDVQKLYKLYDEGYEDAQRLSDEFLKFIRS